MADSLHLPWAKPLHWTSTEVSHKAWMSIRDADILESLLLRLAALKNGAPLRVLEWGCGRSTLWYGALLQAFGIPHTWLGVEHNREYFQKEVEALFLQAPGTQVVLADNVQGAPPPSLDTLGRTVVVFDHGSVAPFDSGRMEDRLVNMDAYVALPARWGYHCDIAIIDGRKRRRCALAALRLLAENGVVMLHDARRLAYQSAFAAFPFHRTIGDDWWIGCKRPLDLDNLLPPAAFTV